MSLRSCVESYLSRILGFWIRGTRLLSNHFKSMPSHLSPCPAKGPASVRSGTHCWVWRLHCWEPRSARTSLDISRRTLSSIPPICAWVRQGPCLSSGSPPDLFNKAGISGGVSLWELFVWIYFIIIIIIINIMALQPIVGPWQLFHFLDPIYSR
jgi:hypothetical protein